MNMMKRDMDTLIEAVRHFSTRGRKPLTEEEIATVERCEEIYAKAMVEHQKTIEYRKAFRQKKLKDDPLYSRSTALKEQYRRNHPETNEDPTD